MRKLILGALAVLGTLAAGVPAPAAERTVTLAVANMDCSMCGPIVRQSLLRVGGVKRVAVLVEREIATVTFDDARTNLPALIQATTNAGYPSRLAE